MSARTAGGPLAEGTLEEGRVLCPWHAWAFSITDGAAEHDSAQTVEIFALKIQGDRVLIALDE